MDSSAELEIRRLLEEGRITSEEAQALFSALQEGYPELSSAMEDVTFEVLEVQTPVSPPVKEGNGDRGESTGANHHLAASVEAPSGVALPAAASVEIRPGATLRVEELRAAGPPAAEEPRASVVVRGLETTRLTVVRGSGVRLREENGVLVLTWPGGLLLLEIPSRLGRLEFLRIQGSLGLSGYAGPFSVDDLDGPLTVHGPAAPFRLQNVRGPIRLLELAVREGISTIAQSDGDVEIEASAEASISIRAVSTAGSVSLGEDALGAPPAHLRRRGVWRLGAGAAQLNVSTTRGRITLRRPPAAGGGSST